CGLRAPLPRPVASARSEPWNPAGCARAQPSSLVQLAAIGQQLDQRVDQLLRAKWLCQDDGAPMPLVHCASVARLEQKWYTASEQFIRQAKGVSARKPHVEHGSVRPLACYQLPSF